MTDKRFEIVMNEFDEVEYIMDKAMMEDRDFAEFIDFVEDVCKENEQLKKALLFFVDVANAECSSNWLEDMEKDCKKLFNCTYEEAKEKYGDYEW